ncbi:hypothetical protein CCHL11_07289 [Colletotrichum chlorophyti]|uniref:Uncharacterized protein n=1 Tax=Colletotrichum chlorophyti TaxID=708187 RepID=A0A1Q8RA53_9PEZI|nr:hypothetical protein CCHL11_07289 [Colletotrichum chlorophyti]
MPGYSKPLPTPTEKDAPSEFKDMSGGETTLTQPALPTPDQPLYREVMRGSAPEYLENEDIPMASGGMADSHRKSKTEFSSIPSEIVRVGLDMAVGPDTGTHAHRKSSTEFRAISVSDASPKEHPRPGPEEALPQLELPNFHTSSQERKEEEQGTSGRLWQRSEPKDAAQRF